MSQHHTEVQALHRRLQFVRELKLELVEGGDSLIGATVQAYGGLVDELIAEVALEVHRSAKTGTDDLSDLPRREPAGRPPSLPPVPMTAKGNAVDVFGGRVEPIALDQVTCPNCGRKVAAGRFAPHLDKCTGKGRQASRNAKVVMDA
eukprot:scaffold18.g2012.t1